MVCAVTSVCRRAWCWLLALRWSCQGWRVRLLSWTVGRVWSRALMMSATSVRYAWRVGRDPRHSGRTTVTAWRLCLAAPSCEKQQLWWLQQGRRNQTSSLRTWWRFHWPPGRVHVLRHRVRHLTCCEKSTHVSIQDIVNYSTNTPQHHFILDFRQTSLRSTKSNHPSRRRHPPRQENPARKLNVTKTISHNLQGFFSTEQGRITRLRNARWPGCRCLILETRSLRRSLHLLTSSCSYPCSSPSSAAPRASPRQIPAKQAQQEHTHTHTHTHTQTAHVTTTRPDAEYLGLVLGLFIYISDAPCPPCYACRPPPRSRGTHSGASQ